MVRLASYGLWLLCWLYIAFSAHISQDGSDRALILPALHTRREFLRHFSRSGLVMVRLVLYDL